MVKKVLYFGNPVYLSCKDEQLIINDRNPENMDSTYNQIGDKFESDLSSNKYEKRMNRRRTVALEDIGAVIIDSYGVTISQYLISKLIENNAALITCNEAHHPVGMFLNLDGNTLQSQKFKHQISATIPLKKQLWQQTVSAKILNQASLLKLRGRNMKNMKVWSKSVSSGDKSNLEARASSYYWKNLFSLIPEFRRDRFGEPPNNLFNYTYAILRAIIARSLVASGLLPTLGIHHRNKYNAYCLADDIMEPYRPFADKLVCKIADSGYDDFGLTADVKKELLSLPFTDVMMKGEKSPLIIAAARTASSVSKCFERKSKKIVFPTLE